VYEPPSVLCQGLAVPYQGPALALNDPVFVTVRLTVQPSQVGFVALHPDGLCFPLAVIAFRLTKS
jgi:hypothetical protein